MCTGLILAASGGHPGPGWIEIVLYVALALVVVPRLLWFAAYYAVFWARNKRHPLASLLRATTSLSTDVWSAAADRRAARHARFVTVAQHQQDTLMISGSVALAAWTVLFTTAAMAPASDLTPLARNLLLASSLALLAGPLLFRSPGREITSLGREIAGTIGYAAFVLAMCAVLADLFGTLGKVLATVLAAAVALRDLLECIPLIFGLSKLTA